MFLRRLSPRTLFSLTPSSSKLPILPRLCHSHSHPESRNVSVSVWWDLDTCTVPSGVDAFRGAQAITAAIESNGIRGPIEITAFGDMARLSTTNQKALNSAEIPLIHLAYDGSGKATAHKIICSSMSWASQNPPPAHICFITGDEGLFYLLDNLRERNYNTLLASKEPCVLSSAATMGWNWDSLVRGENLTGRYFNRPPHDSWYGRYEGPLEDPSTA